MVTLVVDIRAPVRFTDLDKWFTVIPLILHYREYLNIYINLTQLWQEHDQHINLVSSGYMDNFSFITIYGKQLFISFFHMTQASTAASMATVAKRPAPIAAIHRIPKHRFYVNITI